MTDIEFIRDQIGFYHGLHIAGEISFDLFLDIAGKLADDLPPEIRDDVKRELVLLGVEAGGRLEVV